jgi:hypothetical protein
MDSHAPIPEKSRNIQEWKHYRSYRGGVNNLAVCRLNFPGDGAAADRHPHAVIRNRCCWTLCNERHVSAEFALAGDALRALKRDPYNSSTRDKLISALARPVTGMLNYVVDNVARQISRQSVGSDVSTLSECAAWHEKAAQQLRECSVEIHFNCIGHAELKAAIAGQERFAKALRAHIASLPGSADVGPGSKVAKHISKRPGVIEDTSRNQHTTPISRVGSVLLVSWRGSIYGAGSYETHISKSSNLY